MKKTVLLTLVIGIMTVFSANAQKKAMDKFMVQVDGLGCPFCAYGLEKKFKEFKGIKAVKIDIETGDFSFKYPAEKALSMQDVEKQVEKAGYTPVSSKIERADGTIEESKGLSETKVAEGKLTSKSLMVAGNCGMCEARIVKAAKSVQGVSEASWNKDTKMMRVGFDATMTALLDIEKAISDSGHDTKNHQTDDATYNALPACCHYDRISQ